MLIATARLESEHGYATRIHTGDYELTADEPVARHGTATGPSPFQLMLSALGACTTITLRMDAERKGWELGTISVSLVLRKPAEGPDEVLREVRASAPLTPEMRAKLAEIADKTPVTRALRAGLVIQTTFP